ncbi:MULTISPECIES: exopolysaccharide biosynthesis protein [unclassified Sinorhizobium]|uniref:exopolysaccharide biosynthesis protein n=1 Tax=unclassified Sinorhizobium TaxID=2613772 RepID=UPI0035259924
MKDSFEFRDTSTSMSDTLRASIAAIGGNSITLRQLMTIIGEQGLLLLCALLSLPFLVPVSIPGVSTVFGAAIILISLAITLNRLPWFPGRILDRELETGRLLPVLEKGVSIISRIDRYVRPRLLVFTSGLLVNRFNGAALMIGGILLMFPLSFIPLSNTFPAVAILSLAIGCIQRDGLLVIGGYVFLIVTTAYFGALLYAAVSAGQSLSTLVS